MVCFRGQDEKLLVFDLETLRFALAANPTLKWQLKLTPERHNEVKERWSYLEERWRQLEQYQNTWNIYTFDPKTSISRQTGDSKSRPSLDHTRRDKTWSRRRCRRQKRKREVKTEQNDDCGRYTSNQYSGWGYEEDFWNNSNKYDQ